MRMLNRTERYSFNIVIPERSELGRKLLFHKVIPYLPPSILQLPPSHMPLPPFTTAPAPFENAPAPDIFALTVGYLIESYGAKDSAE